MDPSLIKEFKFYHSLFFLFKLLLLFFYLAKGAEIASKLGGGAQLAVYIKKSQWS